MKEIINLLKEKIQLNNFVLCCSTGADSMCLLDLCEKAGLNKQMIIAHVNHNVREQSALEETFIKDFANRREIRIVTKSLTFENLNNFEEVARNKRYEFFDEVACQFNAKFVLLAHNADDNLETIIMRFLKSSSLKGYAGIEKEVNLSNYVILRPLLNISKNTIYEYNKNNGVTYFEDATNATDDHLRNRIRKYITPVLLKENPNLYEAVENYSNSLFGANSLLEKEKISFVKTYVQNVDNDIVFEYKYLLEKDEYLRKQILFRILRRYMFSIDVIDSILTILESDNNKIISKIAKDVTLIKEYGFVTFTNKLIEIEQFRLEITKDGSYDLPFNQKIDVNKNICNLHTNEGDMWYNINSLPIVIRTRIDGDKMIRNSKKGTYVQSVSNILTNKKVPTLKRIKLLVLEENGNITSILGLKIK